MLLSRDYGCVRVAALGGTTMSEKKARGLLAEFSEELANVVDRVGRSVVRVNARHRLPGSGLVWTADGIVVTADHVVEYEEGITVGLPDGREVAAKLLGRDPGSGLAALQLSVGSLSPVEPIEAGEARVGYLVLAVGRPSPGGLAATLGIVSARTGPWRTWRGGLLDSILLTDVAMYPGFSGGALATASGRVAGLNSSLLLRGMAGAVPASAVQRVVQMLREHGRVRRGYLGVASHPVPLPAELKRQHGLQQEGGLLIVGVEPGSPAAKAGLLLGDVLVAAAGQPVEDGDGLQMLLGPERVGQPLAVRLIRAGELREIAVTVGERY